MNEEFVGALKELTKEISVLIILSGGFFTLLVKLISSFIIIFHAL